MNLHRRAAERYLKGTSPPGVVALFLFCGSCVCSASYSAGGTDDRCASPQIEQGDSEGGDWDSRGIGGACGHGIHSEGRIPLLKLVLMKRYRMEIDVDPGNPKVSSLSNCPSRDSI